MLCLAAAFALVLVGIWSALALWYRLPAPDPVRMAASGLFFAFGCAAAVSLFSRFRIQGVLAFLAALTLVGVWWSTIEPAADADWAPDVARQVTGRIDGDVLTLKDVRAFAWRAGNQATERWETRTYDLSRLQSLDFFMSYWAGPEMAHFIVSFGFQDDVYLAWSAEVRRSRGGAFSPIADAFKSNPLVIIAADERDVVGVRTNVRGEDVQIFRLRASPEAARALLVEYVRDANMLAKKPQFYNSILTNCTTAVVKMMRAVGGRIPFDWRLIVNGYLPDYAYDRGAVDIRLPLDRLRALGRIAPRARAAGQHPDFSRLIRQGVPSPFKPTPPG